MKQEKFSSWDGRSELSSIKIMLLRNLKRIGHVINIAIMHLTIETGPNSEISIAIFNIIEKL